MPFVLGLAFVNEKHSGRAQIGTRRKYCKFAEGQNAREKAVHTGTLSTQAMIG